MLVNQTNFYFLFKKLFQIIHVEKCTEILCLKYKIVDYHVIISTIISDFEVKHSWNQSMNKSKAFCLLNLHYNINEMVLIKFKTNRKVIIIIF